MRAWFLAISACAFISACIPDGHGGDRAEEWTGTIRDACGTTDGAAVAIRLSQSAEMGCDEGIASGSGYPMIVDTYQVDSLKAGVVMAHFVDCPEKCLAADSLLFRIEKVSAGAVSGSLEIRKVPYSSGGRPMPVRKGPFILRKCPRIDGGCG